MDYPRGLGIGGVNLTMFILGSIGVSFSTLRYRWETNPANFAFLETINALETGKYDPSLPLAFKSSRLFKIPIEEIFSDK